MPDIDIDLRGLHESLRDLAPRLREQMDRLGRQLDRDLGPLARRDRERDRMQGDDDDWDDDRPQARREEEREREREREQRRREREQRRHERGSRPTAESSGLSTATLAVQGPITFQLRSQAGDVVVVVGQKGQVQVTLTDAPHTQVSLLAYGDRVEPEFGGRSQLRRGKLRVELPPGSQVDLQSMSGDLEADRVDGDVRLRTLSGDVRVRGCRNADLQTISGDAWLDGASGQVRVQTVSGNAKVSSTSAAPRVSFASTSGNLEWMGTCAKGCRLSTETVSGDVRLAVGQDSSFALSFVSHTGSVDAGSVSLSVKREPKRKHGWGMGSGLYEAVLGAGEGVIESDAFSGDLHLVRR
jgi:hypothetical protein